MIERVGASQERIPEVEESKSSAERSEAKRRQENERSVDDRDRKDSVEVSPEGRAALEAERRRERS